MIPTLHAIQRIKIHKYYNLSPNISIQIAKIYRSANDEIITRYVRSNQTNVFNFYESTYSVTNNLISLGYDAKTVLANPNAYHLTINQTNRAISILKSEFIL